MDDWPEDCLKSTIHIVPKAGFNIYIYIVDDKVKGQVKTFKDRDAQIPICLIPYQSMEKVIVAILQISSIVITINYAKLLNNEIRML